jgi:hypothetical protein
MSKVRKTTTPAPTTDTPQAGQKIKPPVSSSAAPAPQKKSGRSPQKTRPAASTTPPKPVAPAMNDKSLAVTAKVARAPAAKPTAPKDAKRLDKHPSPDASRKAKKPKLVRDSYTIPKNEYLALAALKERITKLDHPAKKSELLRAGIHLLSNLPDAALLDAVIRVPALKTGRPRKNASA